MKKILFCSPTSSVGGISQWSNKIINFFNAKIDNVKIYPCYPEIKDKKTTGNLSFISRLKRGIFLYFPFLSLINKEIKSANYDILHISSSGGFGFFRDLMILKIAKKHGIKTVFHFHFGRMPEILSNNTIESKLFKHCAKYIDKFVAIDTPTFNSLIENNYSKSYYLPNPLSEDISSLVNSTLTSPQENLIVYVGHVLKTKGINELVEACKNIPDIKLRIIGPYEDVYFNELKELAGENNDEWLEFLGSLPIEEVIRHMKESIVFTLPSYTEGFPNVIIESMACGCTIISTPVGAIPEMLNIENDPCGIIVPTKDSNALETAIRKVIENPENYKSLGGKAQKRVNEVYSIEKICRQLLEIWE